LSAPPDRQVADFIRSTCRSVWTLELLCYLRNQSERAFSREELIAGLRASEVVVSQGLQALGATGLVVSQADDLVRYAPASEELDRLSAAAEAMYVRNADAVRRMIVAAANPGISAFANAFKFRSE